MTKVFILTCFFFTSVLVVAQEPFEQYTKWRSPDGRNIDLLYVNSSSNRAEMPDIKTDGSPYINKEFQPSVIYLNDGTALSDIFLRFNAFENQMEFKESLIDDDSLIKIVNKTPDFIIKIADTFYDFVPFSGSIEKGIYFEILFRGEKVDLYKKTTKKFTEAKIARTSFEVDFPRRFKDQFDYFFVNPQGKLVEIKGSEKKKIDSFGFMSKELNQYVKEYKTNLNEEKDLIKLVEYLDSLL